MSWQVFADATQEGLWFKDLVPALADAELKVLADRNKNPPAVAALLAYDRPDIIVTNGEEPVLVLEQTKEVPTGHNIGQRMGRIVRAAEHRVPVIKFLPFDARKHGEHTGICNLNIRLLDAFRRMSDLHDSPVLAVNWAADADGELVRDGSQDKFLGEILSEYFDSGLSLATRGFATAYDLMVAEYDARLAKRKSYGRPPPSVKIIPTASLAEELARRGVRNWSLPASLAARQETVLYTCDMTPGSCRREDPYTGMQFVYDYQLCRTGPSPSDKKRNLILNIPQVPLALWNECNPNDVGRKSCLWYKTANAILLKDGAIQVVP